MIQLLTTIIVDQSNNLQLLRDILSLPWTHTVNEKKCNVGIGGLYNNKSATLIFAHV